MSLEGRRILTQIDNHVVNCTLRAAYQLGLSRWRDLVMHAPQRSLLLVERDVALHGTRTQLVFQEFPFAPGTGKKATFVFPFFQLNHVRTRQFGLGKSHERTSTSGIGTTSFPPHSPTYAIC